SPLTIANIGGGTLTWAVQEATAGVRPSSQMMTQARLAKSVAVVEQGSFERNTLAGGGMRGQNVLLGSDDISQMADNTPGDEGVSCNLNDGSGVSDNSWWRRFYFNEHP